MTITPKNWASFQHYKDRSPPWIKLHHALLDNFEFHCLPVASRALAPCLWLLASEYDGGRITLASKALAFRLHRSEAELIEAIKPLIDAGFFIDDSNMLAESYQDAIPETEREAEAEERHKHREEGKTPQKGFSPLPQEQPLPSALEGKKNGKNGAVGSLAALPTGALARPPPAEQAEPEAVAEKKPHEKTLAEINEEWRGTTPMRRP